MPNEKDTKEYDFYYADLGITITVKPDEGNIITELTDNQRLALQQIIYLALNTFSYTRALFLADDQT